MKFLEIINIMKKDIPIHYRREFTGKAVFITNDMKKQSHDIHFIIEYSHAGTFDVRVHYAHKEDGLHTHALPALKEHIIHLEKKGALKRFYDKPAHG